MGISKQISKQSYILLQILEFKNRNFKTNFLAKLFLLFSNPIAKYLKKNKKLKEWVKRNFTKNKDPNLSEFG